MHLVLHSGLRMNLNSSRYAPSPRSIRALNTVPLHTWDNPASCQMSTSFIRQVVKFLFTKATRRSFSFSVSATGLPLRAYGSKTLAEIDSSKENSRLRSSSSSWIRCFWVFRTASRQILLAVDAETLVNLWIFS